METLVQWNYLINGQSMLIDTNIAIEITRNQKSSQDCRDLFRAISQEISPDQAYITQFSLNAICAISGDIAPEFLRKLFLMIHEEKIKIINMDTKNNLMILVLMKQLNLDFDDTLQFIAANQLGTYLVTFDQDFKNTGLTIKTPKQVLKKILKNSFILK
jgi:predicted nucleic acid-binding protein